MTFIEFELPDLFKIFLSFAIIRVFEGQVFDELWSIVNFGAQIWSAKEHGWWSDESSFSVSYICNFHCGYTWISIVVMDFLWLIMLFAEYLRNHCSMWNVLAATKIPMPLDKRESILKCFFYIVFPSKILLSVYIGQALTQNQNLEQISVDRIRGNDPTNLLVCSENVVPKY